MQELWKQSRPFGILKEVVIRMEGYIDESGNITII